MADKTKLEMRIEDAKTEAERFLRRCHAFEMADPQPSRWASQERAALKRAAIDCGHAMRQINKSNY